MKKEKQNRNYNFETFLVKNIHFQAINLIPVQNKRASNEHSKLMRFVKTLKRSLKLLSFQRSPPGINTQEQCPGQNRKTACLQTKWKIERPSFTSIAPVYSLVTLTQEFTCLKTSSSSRLLLSSNCLRPLSSASRIRLFRSANMANAWMRLSS